jgi:hypothetical protein
MWDLDCFTDPNAPAAQQQNSAATAAPMNDARRIPSPFRFLAPHPIAGRHARDHKCHRQTRPARDACVPPPVPPAPGALRRHQRAHRAHRPGDAGPGREFGPLHPNHHRRSGGWSARRAAGPRTRPSDLASAVRSVRWAIESETPSNGPVESNGGCSRLACRPGGGDNGRSRVVSAPVLLVAAPGALEREPPGVGRDELMDRVRPPRAGGVRLHRRRVLQQRSGALP